MLYQQDKTPLTGEELAFQCLSLTYAALHSNELDIKEALLFILLEKTNALYSLFPEVCLDE